MKSKDMIIKENSKHTNNINNKIAQEITKKGSKHISSLKDGKKYWWLSQNAKYITVTKNGTSVVLKKKSTVLKKNHDCLLPAVWVEPLPKLEFLLPNRRPSHLLKFSLVQILLCYCQVVCSFTNQVKKEDNTMAEILLTICPSLLLQKTPNSLKGSLCEFNIELSLLISVLKKSLKKIFKDVSVILDIGRGGILIALAHVQHTLSIARRTHIKSMNVNRIIFEKILLAERKILFISAWVNELNEKTFEFLRFRSRV
jgi:hypothetical protein